MLLSKDKIEALEKRWEGREDILHKIADSIMKDEDWTVHLNGLPYLEEAEKYLNQKNPADLRGANLRRYLMPTTTMEPASQDDIPNIAYIIREANRNNTPLRGGSPFPVPPVDGEEIRRRVDQGSRFFVALQMDKVIGVVQMDSADELKHLTEDKPHYELSNLSVLPAYRHLGVARSVLREFEKFTRNEGRHSHILLRTIVEHGLANYWERAGYILREVHQKQVPQGSPAHMEAVMTKKID